MKINYESYKDKVKACWIGKNIGGTIGTPYEGTHELLDVKGFTTEPGEPLPNDDLDLQLIWLHALENEGANNISSELLGEYWLDLITPYWAEYGIGKTNMQRGLTPPTSGDVNNDWKNSNGAWIRTEIWACAAPATPELAVKFAIEDAKVDHGTGEGTYAAAFVAAMQSSAFALSTARECIDIAFSAIPESSRVYKSVRAVIDCYDTGKDWQTARNTVLDMNSDLGSGWFEAPSNVAYSVLGLLYGENDFKKSVLLATNCGDDTDCTAGTVGATLGLLFGTKIIPEDWSDYIGDKIITCSVVNISVGRLLPKTCAELSERVCAIAPSVLYSYEAKFHTKFRRLASTSFTDGDSTSEGAYAELQERITQVKEKHLSLKENSVETEKAALKVRAAASKVEITANDEIKVEVDFVQRGCVQLRQYPLELRWILPDGFSAEGPKSAIIKTDDTPVHTHHGYGKLSLNYTLRSGDSVLAKQRCILEITSPGRHTAIYLPLVFLG
ncbi:MAG: ADP-ribosylglycohydrolase family protein [Ruminococcaceae bacterium]|nr:ADP-ribosylglycohydrolase family protein [Oscillospiraceae bacterium]